MRQQLVTDLITGLANLLLAVLVVSVRTMIRELRLSSAERRWVRDHARWATAVIPLIAGAVQLMIEKPPAEPPRRQAPQK